MENASKALIIAGAILLAILIISLGMMVLSNATGLLKNGGMDKAGVQAFNETFLKYDGNKKGSEIRSLVSEVMSNNNSDEASDETRVSINGDGNGPVTLGAGEDEQPHYRGQHLPQRLDTLVSPAASRQVRLSRVLLRPLVQVHHPQRLQGH